MIAERTALKNLEQTEISDGYFRKEEAMMSDKIQKISG
jgi:hypothetical protein